MKPLTEKHRAGLAGHTWQLQMHLNYGRGEHGYVHTCKPLGLTRTTERRRVSPGRYETREAFRVEGCEEPFEHLADALDAVDRLGRLQPATA